MLDTLNTESVDANEKDDIMSPIEIAIVDAIETLANEGAKFQPVRDLDFAADGGFVEHLSFPPSSVEVDAMEQLNREDVENDLASKAAMVKALVEGAELDTADEVDAEPAAAKLCFTFLRMPEIPGKEATYEVHATGCRDLKHQAMESNSWLAYATDGPAALADELDAVVDGDAKVKLASDYKVMPCCNLKRMRAAGRA